MTVPPAGDAREEFVADMEGTMQGALTGSDPSLEGDVEVDLAQINGNPIRARRPRAMQTTVLTFLSTLTRGFDSDFEAIQDEFTKTVQSAFTIENVANALQTPELTNKYGDFIVTETETDGSIETLVSIARDPELGLLIFATPHTTCNGTHHRAQRPLPRAKIKRVSQKASQKNLRVR